MESEVYPENISFKKYWLILKRHWLPAGSAFFLIVFFGMSNAASQIPVYVASGQLLFKKRDAVSSLLTQGTEQIGQLESVGSKNTPIDTEAQILRSAPLVEKVIAELNLRGGDGKLLSPEIFNLSLAIGPITGTDILFVSYTSTDPRQSAIIVNKLLETYIEYNIAVNRSQTVAALEFINTQLPKTESNLRRAELAVREFEEKNNVISLVDEATSAVSFISTLNTQISTTQADLVSISGQIDVLKNTIGLDSATAMALNSVTQSPAVQEVVAQLQALSNTLALDRLRFQPNHPIIINLEDQQAALTVLLQERIAQVLGGNQFLPPVDLQAGPSKQQLIDTLIQSEVKKQGLIGQLEAFIQAKAASQERANLLPRLQQQHKELIRNVETIQSKYNILVQRGQEIQIAETQNIGNASVVSPASVPIKPTASKKKQIVIGAAILGGLFYVVIAFTLELLDPSVKTTKEIRETFPYPYLGIIPLLKEPKRIRIPKKLTVLLVRLKYMARRSWLARQPWLKQATKDSRQYLNVRNEVFTPKLFVRDDPTALVSEAYRMLQSNLKLLTAKRAIKTIAITSAISKEGKSTVVANLATSLAQMGRRVLLIDADFHRPIQHHIWQLSNDFGLCDVITHKVDLTIAAQTVYENLQVLPSGNITHRHLALTDSEEMRHGLNEISKGYDFIILDTSPLLLVSGTLAIATLTDGMILVTRPGIIDHVSATAAKDLFTQSGLCPLGLVINGVAPDNEYDSYFRHTEAYY